MVHDGRAAGGGRDDARVQNNCYLGQVCEKVLGDAVGLLTIQRSNGGLQAQLVPFK